MFKLINDTKVLLGNQVLIEDKRHSSILFTQLHYSHVKREDNKATHSLAKYAMHILDFLV